MNKTLRLIDSALIAIALAVGFASCSNDEPENSENSEYTDNIDYSASIEGVWMQTHVKIMNSEEGETQYFDAKSYKYMRLTLDENNVLTAESLKGPSLSVISTTEYTLDGDRILDGKELAGTINENSDSKLEITWETSSVFNLGGEYKSVAYYMLDTWSK